MFIHTVREAIVAAEKHVSSITQTDRGDYLVRAIAVLGEEHISARGTYADCQALRRNWIASKAYEILSGKTVTIKGRIGDTASKALSEYIKETGPVPIKRPRGFDDWDIAVARNACQFIAYLHVDKSIKKVECKNYAIALLQAKALKAQWTSIRPAMVYAVTAEGRTTLVTEELAAAAGL